MRFYTGGKIVKTRKTHKRSNSDEDMELKATSNEDKLVNTMRDLVLDKTTKQAPMHRYEKSKTFGLYANSKPKTFKL